MAHAANRHLYKSHKADVIIDNASSSLTLDIMMSLELIEIIGGPDAIRTRDLCLRSNLTCPSTLFDGFRSDALYYCNH